MGSLGAGVAVGAGVVLFACAVAIAEYREEKGENGECKT